MIKPLLLGGPSGVGKSTFCAALQHKGWVYLEADQSPLDGIDEIGIRDEWDHFWNHGSAERLHAVLVRIAMDAGKTNIVLSLPSGAVPSSTRILSSLDLLSIRFLWGNPQYCLRDFLARELLIGRNYNELHWRNNNSHAISLLSEPFYAPYLVEVFDADGARLEYKTLLWKLQGSLQVAWQSSAEETHI